MFGKAAHPIFIKQFVSSSSKRLLSRFRGVLSLGNTSYYIHGDQGFFTRVFIYNYFRFMCDADIAARWRIQCYARNGAIVAELEGVLKSDEESVVIDLAQVKGLDAYGVLRVYVIPDDPNLFIPNPHGNLFFNEYYIPGTSVAIMAHSLHPPRAGHGPIYIREASGLTVHKGLRPYLFIASGCSFNRMWHPACTKVSLTFLNRDGQEKKIAVPAMKPMACQKLDLFAMDPEMAGFLGNQPFAIKVIGEQFLAKPFIFLTDGKTALGEHL